MAHPMAGAITTPLDGSIRRNEGITIVKNQDPTMVGSCNACTARINDPAAYATVTEVNLRGLQFRLCPSCATNLKSQL